MGMMRMRSRLGSRAFKLIVCSSIALKANSSDIYIYDSVFRRGQGLAVGSIGQYPGQYEHITNMYARNITVIGTRWAGLETSYLGRWTTTKI